MSTAIWQKTWQKKTAEGCRSVQEIAGQANARDPGIAAENGVSRGATFEQLGYGDAICKYLKI